MANRPSTYLNWTNGTYPTVVQPPANFLAAGWQPGQAPPSEYMNWLFYETDQWIQWFDQLTATSIPDSVIRLINGGLFQFSSSTGVFSWSQTANLAIPSIPDASNAIAAGSVTLNDGDVAYTVANSPVTAQGNGTVSSNILTSVNFTANLSIGMNVTGPGVPSSTTVTGVGTNTVTLSHAITAASTPGTFVFSNSGALTVLTAASVDLLPNLNTILLARRAGAVVYVGVNCSQMVLRDGEYKTLIGSGYFSLYQATAGQNLPAGTLVYLSAGSIDGGRTAGEAYPLDCSAANQANRSIYAGVVITAVTSGNVANILYSGFYAETGLTPGVDYYADPLTPGGITSTSPTGSGEKIVPVGFAVTSTSLLFTGTSSGGGGSVQTFPIFFDDPLQYGNGVQTVFTLTDIPLSGSSVFVFIDGLVTSNTEWTFSGSQTITFASAPALGAKIQFKMILSDQIYLDGSQEVPLPISGSPSLFSLVGNPLSKASCFLFVDGQSIDSSQWTLIQGIGSSSLSLVTPLAPGQDLFIIYFQPVGTTNGGSGVSTLANVGGGTAIFAGLSGSVAQLKTLVAGTNVTITEDATEITINASGGGGGSRETHGNAGSPILIDPTVGIVLTTTADQVWWVAPSSGSGAVPITAAAAISGSAMLGQEVTIKSVASANYLVMPNGAGTDQDGNCNMGPFAQSITYKYDGTNFSEDSRRV